MSTKLGILFQELLKVTAVAERAEQLATNASAGSNDYMREAERQRVQEDFALRQSNQLRALEQQIGDTLGERGRALSDLQVSLRAEAEARNELQQQVEWLLKSRDKTALNTQENLAIVAGKMDQQIVLANGKNQSLLEQAHQNLAAQLAGQRDSNGAEFGKIASSFLSLKQQIDQDILQLRTDVGRHTASQQKEMRW